MDVVVENTQIDQGIPRVQGILCAGHTVRADQGAGPGWRDGGNRRNHRLHPEHQHPGGSHRRQLAANWKSLQADDDLHPIAGVAVLPNTPDYPWVVRTQNIRLRTETQGDCGLLVSFMNSEKASKFGETHLRKLDFRCAARCFSDHSSGELVLPDRIYGEAGVLIVSQGASAPDYRWEVHNASARRDLLCPIDRTERLTSGLHRAVSAGERL